MAVDPELWQINKNNSYKRLKLNTGKWAAKTYRYHFLSGAVELELKIIGLPNYYYYISLHFLNLFIFI